MIGICPDCGKQKELDQIQDYFVGSTDETTRKRICSDCKRELQELVDEINAEALALAKNQDNLKDTGKGSKNARKRSRSNSGHSG